MWLDDLDEALVVLSRSSWGIVTVDLADGPYYVMFLLDELEDSELPDEDDPITTRQFLVEARSNEYLHGPDELSPEQEAALARQRWSPPHSDCSPEDGDAEHLNWFCFVSLEAGTPPSPAVVALVLATLGIYGADEGAEVIVSYHCSEGRKGVPNCN